MNRKRGLASLAVLTLAIGIGATTTMFSVVHAALLRPLPFDQPDRLAILFHAQSARDGLQQLRWSWPNISSLQRSSHSFESIGSYTFPSLAISGGGEPEQVDSEVVSSAYFRVLRVRAGAGRLFQPEDDTESGAQPIALISDRLWKRRFGGQTSALYGPIRVNNVAMTIAGILPEGFAGLSGKAEVWISPPMAARLQYAAYLTTPQNFIGVVARLRDGATWQTANAELATIGATLAGDPSRGGGTWSAEAVPVDEIRVDPVLRRSAWILLSAAAGVLLIACVNVGSLFLVDARARRREMAIRLAIGASRASLIRGWLGEASRVAGAAGFLGIVLTLWGIRAVTGLTTAALPMGRSTSGIGAFGGPAFDWSVLLFAVAVSGATVLLFALVPAWRASRPALAADLREDVRAGGTRLRAHATLVVVEITLAAFLVAGSGLLIQSFARIQNLRTGFVPDRVLTFWVRPPSSRYKYPDDGPRVISQMLERIERVPGVESAGANRCTPFMGCSRSVVFFADRPNDTTSPPGVGRHYVSPDYFRTLGIPLLAGRLLTAADREGAVPVTVINESGARLFWPGESPIGKRVWFGTTTGPFADRTHAVEIVGMVGDVRYEPIDRSLSAPRADFYTSYLQFAYPDTMFMVKAAADPAALVPELRRAVAAVDTDVPIYDVMPLGERLDTLVARPRFNASLLGAFGGIALLLAAIGVYGVLSYSVSLRLREIGVRLALGANRREVFGLVIRYGLRLAAIGCLIGLASAAIVVRVVGNLGVGVTDADPGVLLVAAGVMLGAALLAAALPARRASGVDPVVVLRQE